MYGLLADIPLPNEHPLNLRVRCWLAMRLIDMAARLAGVRDAQFTPSQCRRMRDAFAFRAQCVKAHRGDRVSVLEEPDILRRRGRPVKPSVWWRYYRRYGKKL